MYHRPYPTQHELRRLLDYCPETGVFTWLARDDVHYIWNNKNAGKEAGSPNKKGHIAILVHNQSYYAHRLAWIYCKGDIPEGMQVDHENGVKSDNRLANLRLATHGQNVTNSRLRKGKALPKGVSRTTGGKKPFRARIDVNKRSIALGVFNTIEEASQAYVAAAHKYHQEFARI